MAHIDLKNVLPGIRSLMMYSPQTAKPLNELAEILLHDPNNSLAPGDRELIADYVSHLNNCFFCENVHGAIAGFYMGCDLDAIKEIQRDPAHSDISRKMKALLCIAASVQKGGKHVTEEQIQQARDEGVSDREIHDTVLIAAAFCMFNRYVDGLDTWAPTDLAIYENRAELRAREGYINSMKAEQG